MSGSTSADESNTIGDCRIQSVDEDLKNVTVVEWYQKTEHRTGRVLLQLRRDKAPFVLLARSWPTTRTDRFQSQRVNK